MTSCQVKLMSDLIRTRLGIGRQMVLVSITRLQPTRWRHSCETDLHFQFVLFLWCHFFFLLLFCSCLFVRCEVGGWPPLVLCFEHSYDRDAVLSKAHLLDRYTDRKTPIVHKNHCLSLFSYVMNFDVLSENVVKCKPKNRF